MVCPKCAGAALAGGAAGAALNNVLADKVPFLKQYPYILPTVMGAGTFLLSSATMTYGGYNLINYVYNAIGYQSSDLILTPCHENKKSATSTYSYNPLNSEFDAEISSSKLCIDGTGKNEKFILTQPINHVFGRGGLDVFMSGKGEDHFYFSMCSTRIINGRVATIYDFDDQEDKIHLFCTKKQVTEGDVSIRYNTEEDVTYVVIAGNFEETAIAIVGNHPDLVADNIEFNVKYADVVATGVCDQIVSEA